MMYEGKSRHVASRTAFLRRLGLHLAYASVLLAASLLVGMLGYSKLEHLAPLDAFLNSAMLLGGMGPVNAPVTPAGKLFAGFYALYAGLVFVVTTALMFTPVLHRLLHQFHADTPL